MGIIVSIQGEDIFIILLFLLYSPLKGLCQSWQCMHFDTLSCISMSIFSLISFLFLICFAFMSYCNLCVCVFTSFSPCLIALTSLHALSASDVSLLAKLSPFPHFMSSLSNWCFLFSLFDTNSLVLWPYSVIIVFLSPHCLPYLH